MKNNNPIVSIIIPTYNSSATIMRTLESVFSQTYTAWEIIIIDDGSTDDTKQLLQPYRDNKKIIYLYQNNGGPGSARNNGIRHATGEYIAFLDADDYWHAEKLEKQIAAFQENPRIVVCSTETYCIDPYSDLIWETVRSPWTKPRSGKVVPYFAFHKIITLSSALIPKKYILKVGLFDESRDIIMTEDLDLWLKLAPVGDFVTLNEPLTFYQTRAGITIEQITANHKKIKEVFRRNKNLATGWVKFWYSIGYSKAHILYFLSTIKIIRVLKKIGLNGIIKELSRRGWLKIEWIIYPIVIARLSKIRSNKNISTKELLDFAYHHNHGALVLGQIRSEIESFLELIKQKKPKNILEIGTANGGNLFLFAQVAEKGGKILSIDLPHGAFGGGYSRMKQVVYKNFVSSSKEIYLIRDNSHSDQSLQQVKDILGQGVLDVLFIDGDHTYEGVKADFDMYGPLVRKGGIIGFHDIALSPTSDYGVEKFWNEIKSRHHSQEIIADTKQIGYGIGVIHVE